jgi:uncharacterized protein YjbI with pentapeptide repeats
MANYHPKPEEIGINHSATELRNYTLAFVSFLLYVLITAASTEHEQLLRISAVKLPLLDIDIPIVQFYLFSPLLILILHFHLLLQHLLFSQQYFSFKTALETHYPDSEDRIRFMKSLSGNLSLLHLLGGYQKYSVQILLAGLVTICLIIFPLIDLWFLQAKFLPFHDPDYTNWQVLMVISDCFMLAILLPKMLDEQDNAWRWWTAVFSLWRLPQRYGLLLLRRFYYHAYLNHLYSPIQALMGNQATIKKRLKKLRRYYLTAQQASIISAGHFLTVLGLNALLISVLIISIFVSTIPQWEEKDKKTWLQDREKWVVRYLPANWINAKTKTLFLTELFHNNDFLARNLDLEEKILTADAHLSHELENSLDDPATLKKIAGLDLKKRDLRYANFYKAQLPKADLRQADLRKAKLSVANLSSANLFLANLSAADLGFANLLAANLSVANLEYANLSAANLSAADLFRANLSQADLSSANLSAVHLRKVNLSAANLDGANLSAAFLYGVQYDDKTLFTAIKNEPTCLKDNLSQLPICQPINNKEAVKKIVDYWVNELACADKKFAAGIIHYIWVAEIKNDLIPALKAKLTDKNCVGIWELDDNYKRLIKEAK